MAEQDDRNAKARRINAWSQSTAWRAIGRAAITEWNERRRSLARCGAVRKRDGEPCENLAMENGRCRYHGGRTPSGAGWHRTQWPKKTGTDGGERRLGRKIRDAARAAREREERAAERSPAERDAHARWQRAHKPGPPEPRAAARERRRQNEAARELLQLEPSAPSSATGQHEAELRHLRAQLAVIEATARGEGIFA